MTVSVHLAPSLLAAAQDRVRRARNEHHALHREFMRHLARAYDEDSDDWRCRTGGSCEEADRIHKEATAAGARWMLARQDEHRAMRARFSVVTSAAVADRAWSRVAAEEGR